jgi:Domain of unknown function (DUF3536)/Glycosyl hydrolase family 57
MIEQIFSHDPIVSPKIGHAYLCMHGHFYQPPREDPFTGIIPVEAGATPFPNFNEKITAECYQPNAEAGNFDALSFDMGPTLAVWLEQAHPEVYRSIIASEHMHWQRHGVSNALAQPYNHTILPLATTRDKRTQILWGLQDYRHRYGHDAHGMWLTETAVDRETLDIMVQQGITYTILAPWQATTPIDPTEPYIVPLYNGRRIAVFFYNAPLSGGVSFDWNMTTDADIFAASYLPEHLVPGKLVSGEPQLIQITTDGELYGHHKPSRDKFLMHLIHYAAPSYGFEMCTLERYMKMYPPTREACLRMLTSWSCGHDTARWSTGCQCTEGDSSWKSSLYQALVHLAIHGDRLFEQYAGQTLKDPWAARDEYLSLRNGWETLESFWVRHGKYPWQPDDAQFMQLVQDTQRLLEAQFYQQYSFTSCGFFFEDLDRIEPRNNIAFAQRAISLIWQALGMNLQSNFVHDLQFARSWRSYLTGADLYRQLPGHLDPLRGREPQDTSESLRCEVNCTQ